MDRHDSFSVDPYCEEKYMDLKVYCYLKKAVCLLEKLPA